MEDAYEKKYHELEENHFWHKARRNYILQLLKESSKDLSVLDIGCSSGILLNELVEIGFNINSLYGIDISPNAVQQSKENGIQNSFLMDASYIDLKKEFDIIIASDCLEHLEYDEKALNNWHEILKPGGSLYVFVPAFMILWNAHDLANKHFRRYTMKTLKEKLYESGFEINKSSYWNFFLFLPILIVRLISKLKTSKTQRSTGDLDKIPKFNNLFLNLINFENRLLKYINFPFGVSAYCIAKRSSSDKK
jgi:SAM-dependent methyltransferase